MSERTTNEPTPEGRIAAAARELFLEEGRCNTCGRPAYPNKPDYADLRAALKPYVDREIVMAKLQEAGLFSNEKRVKELRREMEAAERAIAKLAGS